MRRIWRCCSPSPGAREPAGGYTILALERCGYQPAEISRVMAELHEVFDFTSPQEAQAHYEHSDY